MSKIVTKITPDKIPPNQGESWWIVHPNNGNVVFYAPIGSVTMCIEAFMSFQQGKIYEIVDNNESKGYISLANSEEIVEMPYYLFARYFDAEVFVTSAANMRQLFSSPINTPAFRFVDTGTLDLD